MQSNSSDSVHGLGRREILAGLAGLSMLGPGPAVSQQAIKEKVCRSEIQLPNWKVETQVSENGFGQKFFPLWASGIRYFQFNFKEDTSIHSAYVAVHSPTEPLVKYPPASVGLLAVLLLQIDRGKVFKSFEKITEGVGKQTAVFTLSDGDAVYWSLIDGARALISLRISDGSAYLSTLIDGYADLSGSGNAFEAGDDEAIRLFSDMDAKVCTPALKVVCSKMNEIYGFGQFRNAIWIKYSERYMSHRHQVGYHILALPMIGFAYERHGLLRSACRAAMEHMARERTADIYAFLRGGRRRPLGMLYRLMLEPLCYAIGYLSEKRSAPIGRVDVV